MKAKLLTSLAILLFSALSTHAQITQGKYLLGGSIIYSNTQDDQNGTPHQKYFCSNIQIGNDFKENTVAGVILSYSHTNNSPISTSDHYGAGVFYRKYKLLVKDLVFYGEADAVYTYTKNIQGKFVIGSEGSRFKGNGAMISFVPGLSYAVFKKLQVELSMPNIASISYSKGKTESTYTNGTDVVTSKSNSFSANANLNANLLGNFAIGFKFLLGK